MNLLLRPLFVLALSRKRCSKCKHSIRSKMHFMQLDLNVRRILTTEINLHIWWCQRWHAPNIHMVYGFVAVDHDSAHTFFRPAAEPINPRLQTIYHRENSSMRCGCALLKWIYLISESRKYEVNIFLNYSFVHCMDMAYDCQTPMRDFNLKCNKLLLVVFSQLTRHLISSFYLE